MFHYTYSRRALQEIKCSNQSKHSRYNPIQMPIVMKRTSLPCYLPSVASCHTHKRMQQHMCIILCPNLERTRYAFSKQTLNANRIILKENLWEKFLKYYRRDLPVNFFLLMEQVHTSTLMEKAILKASRWLIMILYITIMH